MYHKDNWPWQYWTLSAGATTAAIFPVLGPALSLGGRSLMGNPPPLGSLLPPPPTGSSSGSPAAAPSSASRIELARRKGALGQLWEGYNVRFIRTGSFLPILHAMSGLAALQLLMWGVNGIPIGSEEAKTMMKGQKSAREA